MANVIKLEIDTDDSYTEEEKETLLENFLAFIQEEDPSVVIGTESIEVVDSETASGNSQSKDEIIKDFLDNSKFTVRLNIEGDEIGFETTLKLS